MEFLMLIRARLVLALAMSISGSVGAQPATTVAASGLKPGLWEIVTVVERSDTSTRKTVTSRLCYSPEDVASPSRVLPPQRGLGVRCLASEVKAGGDTGIAWKLTCKGKEGALNGTGKMKPGPTGYSAEIRLEGKVGGKPLTVDEKASGQWKGECQ